MKNKLSDFTLHHGNVFIPLLIGRNIIKRQKKITGARFWSQQHCIIFVKTIRDKQIILLIDHSLNGTYVNSSIIRHKAIFLDQHDTIGFGSTVNPFILKKNQTIYID